jgi:hypothetical protein
MQPKRNLRPSIRVTDPNNAMNLKRKRSIANSNPVSHRARILPESDDEAMEPDDPKAEDATSDAQGNGTSSDSVTDDLDLDTDHEEAYALTKALGDADREVSMPTTCHVIF